MLRRVGQAAIRRFGPAALGSLARTWRFEIQRHDRWREVQDSGRPYLLCCWHEALLPVIWHHRALGINALISEATDGEHLAAFVRRIGYELIRGSSSRRATGALRETIRVLREGRPVGLTPDGPRGPRREFKPGAALAVMQTGAILIGVHAEAVPAWRARSWDRTIVPAPFSRIKLAYGPWYDPLEAPNGRNEVIFRGRSALEEAVRLASSPAGGATATS